MEDKLLSFEHRLEQLEAKVEELEKKQKEVAKGIKKIGIGIVEIKSLVMWDDILETQRRIEDLEKSPFIREEVKDEHAKIVLEKLRSALREAAKVIGQRLGFEERKVSE